MPRLRAIGEAFAWVTGAWLTAGMAIVLGGHKRLSWGESIDYGGVILAIVPVALLQGFFARRITRLVLVASGWLLTGATAAALAATRITEDYYCWPPPGRGYALLHQHLIDRSTLFLTVTTPALAVVISALGSVIGRTSGTSSATDTKPAIWVGLSGILPLLLFVNFHPSDCDMAGRMMFYDPVLCMMSVASVIAAFVQGACLRASLRTTTAVVMWTGVGFTLAWFAFHFEHRFPITDSFYRRSEFYISLYWSSLLYIVSAIPLAGSISCLWGKRWSESERRPPHLVAPVALIIVLISMFAYLWHL